VVNRLKDKGLGIYILLLTGNPEQQRYTMRCGIAIGSAAQLAAAHCPNRLLTAVCS